MKNHKDKFATGKLAGFGEGQYLKSLPGRQTQKYVSFAGGYDAREVAEDIASNASRDAMDVYVNRNDRILRAPGNAAVEALVGKSPMHMALHAGLDFRSELLLIDPPEIGIKRETATVWVAAGLPTTTPKKYVWTTYGNTFVFTNGVGNVWVHDAGTNTFAQDASIPSGATYFVFAGRLYIGGAVIDGSTEPLGLAWGGPNGYNDFDSLAAGNELLISDMSIGDRIVAGRTIGFDMAAILMRKSIWVMPFTGDEFRPGDPQPRVKGKGCVAEATAKSVHGGVLYLSDEGIEFFNGNDSENVSAAINDELLSLSATQLETCTASYNPHTQWYYLFTPTRTYILDMLNKRWHRRSLIALAGTPFATQFHATLWSELTGNWSDFGDTTWGDMAPHELDTPDMLFMGRKIDDSYHLEKELYGADAYFGFPQAPRWTSYIQQADTSNRFITHHEARVGYKSTELAVIMTQLPDANSDFQDARLMVMPVTGTASLARMPFEPLITGRGLGIGYRIIQGTPEVSLLEQDYTVRGKAVTTVTAPIQPPTKPTNLQVTVLDDCHARLDWTAPGGAPTSYEVWAKLFNGSYALVDTIVAPAVTYTHATNGAPVLNTALNLRRTECGLIFRDQFTHADGALATGDQWTLQTGVYSYSGNRLTSTSTSGAANIAYVNPKILSWKVRAINAGGPGPFSDESIQYTLPDRNEILTQAVMVCTQVTGTNNPGMIGKRTTSTNGLLMVLSFNTINLSTGITSPSTILSAGVSVQNSHVYKMNLRNASKVIWQDTVLRVNSGSTTLDGVLGKPGFQHTCNDANVANTRFWDDFAVCKNNLIIATGLPVGYKLRAQPSGVVVTSVAGTATLDMVGTTFPQTSIEVLDAANVIQRTITPVVGVWGGDEYAYL